MGLAYKLSKSLYIVPVLNYFIFYLCFIYYKVQRYECKILMAFELYLTISTDATFTKGLILFINIMKMNFRFSYIQLLFLNDLFYLHIECT